MESHIVVSRLLIIAYLCLEKHYEYAIMRPATVQNLLGQTGEMETYLHCFDSSYMTDIQFLHYCVPKSVGYSCILCML